MQNEEEQSELLAAYVTGGLSPDERARLETRLAADPTLAAQLEDLMNLDLSLTQSAGVASVLAGLEDRVSAAIEHARPIRQWAVHPMVRRAAVATAACLMLGTAGYFASTAMDDGKLPGWVQPTRFSEQGNLQLMGKSLQSYSNENKGRGNYGNSAKLALQDRDAVQYSDGHADFQITKQLNRAEETKIPYDDILRYPADWPDLSARRDQTNAQERAYVSDLSPVVNRQGKSFDPTIDVAGKEDLDFKNAPNFSLEGTNGTMAGAGGGQGQQLFFDSNGRRTSGLTDPYAPGGTIKPFKPGETTFIGGVVSSTSAVSGKQAELGLNMRGSGTGLVQQPELQVTGTETSVSVPNGGTLLLGGQTLAMGDTDGEPGGRPNAGVNIPATQPTAVAPEARKIIRSGEIQFEIDKFDSAAATIGKIVGENGGVVATTNSDKLPNGKVRGQMIVRVPPDKLDTFILQLRALGDLKSQRLGSSDVSKEYYDLASELRAGRAMEERLLDMIKNGKGEIKDLLEAEKELANWRGKIEKIIGQQKYYDNLVSLATLTITLQERDIAVAAAAVENESINSGIETDDVEKARTAALDILKDAKARVISSDLKKLDAGQVASTIVADIPPDGSGPVIDRIKQLGKVARLEVQKSMTADPNASQTSAAPKLERKDSRLMLSLYNVANVQPRQTTTIELASPDVSATYNAIATKAVKAGGRVVKGGAAQGRGNNSQADGVFEVPADTADAFLADLKTLGDVITLASTESPDAANVTTSKRGFSLTILPATALPPRQVASLRVEAKDVDASSANLQAALFQAGGRILDASTATDPAGQSIARVMMEVPLAKAADLVAAAKELGVVRAISSSQNPGAPSGALAKARVDVTFATPAAIVSNESGLMSNIRDGLSTSARGLLYGVKLIVIGLCFVLPWAIVLWAGVKIFRRKRAAV